MNIAHVLAQTRVWIDADGKRRRLTRMDPHHRANLIPFLRGNAKTIMAMAAYDEWRAAADEGDLDRAAQEWIANTPLMRRLCELEAGRPIEERRETAQRNAIYEQATGYQKVRLG